MNLEKKFKNNDLEKKEEIRYFLPVSPHRKRNGEEEEMFLFRELCYLELAYARDSK